MTQTTLGPNFHKYRVELYMAGKTLGKENSNRYRVTGFGVNEEAFFFMTSRFYPTSIIDLDTLEQIEE